MAIKTLPSRALIHQLLRYNAETGGLIWLPRSEELILDNNKRAIWNSKFAGKIAGYVRPSMKGAGYLHIGVQRSIFKAHRLVWLHVCGEPVPDMIDHKDHDQLNNRIENLRASTMSQNRANSLVRKDSKTGFKGIHLSRQNRFMVLVGSGKRRYLGTFETIEEATKAYKEAAAEIYGEFARWDQR